MSNLERWYDILEECDRYGFSYDEIFETDLDGLYHFEEGYDDAGMSPKDFY